MEHPYRTRPPWAFWRSAVAGPADGQVDPVVDFPFAVSPSDRVASLGSCFAQHIARHLRDRGFRVMRTEAPPEGADAGEGYALFAANHGNIYTARHLLRLFEEAFGLSAPRGIAWRRPDGRFVDALRPRLHPAGFASPAEVAAARARHLDAVREVFEACEVLVVTLGLIEAWVDARDGTAFPLAPGIDAEPAEPGHVCFREFTFEEVRADLLGFLDAFRELNPAARVILTVSPVPLAATAGPRHVLAASTHAKAVLRVVAEEAARRPGVAYFPAYEMVTGPHWRGRAFAEDLRGVAPEAVAAVMALFDRHVASGAPPLATAPIPAAPAAPPAADAADDADASDYAALLGTICDEDALDPHGR